MFNMKSKLVKVGDEYHLWVDRMVPKIVPFAKYPWDITKQRLSLENCQVIEQSTTQTEWEVEVVMERVFDGYEIVNSNPKVKGSGDKIPKYDTKPKLDADGCLILKLI